MNQQSKRDRHQSLINDRQAKADQLEALRAQRSTALIDGTEFSRGAEIRSLSDDIDALDSAIAVASDAADHEERRQRAATNIERRQADLAQFELKAERIRVLAGRVQGSNALQVADLAEMFTLTAEMESFALPVSGERMLPALNHQNLSIRMSERMARGLSPLDPASVGAFGIIRWQPMPGVKEDWAAAEGALLDGLIGHIRRKSEEYIAEQTAIANAE